MAITNYEELQDAIARYIFRGGDTNVTPYVTDFITMAEADFNRSLRTQKMEARAKVDVSSNYVGLPNDFLQMRTLKLNTTPTIVMEFKSPMQLTRLFDGSYPGKPTHYGILGDELLLAPAPDSTYELEIHYYKKIPALSDDNTTNWLLDNHPDLYLYGSLLQAEPYIQNDERLPTWLAFYTKIMADIETQTKAALWNGSPLTVDVGTYTP